MAAGRGGGSSGGDDRDGNGGDGRWGAGSDAIMFDCDGVLVDVSESYDRTIDMTCRHVLRELGGIDGVVPDVAVDGPVIAAFKESGGFNDEVDLACAAALSVYAAHVTGRDPARFLMEAASHADSTGIRSVRAYVESVCDVSEFAARMGSLDDRHDNPVYSAFDQIFYGPRLYRRMFGRPSSYEGPAMIDRDRVLVTGGLLDVLCGAFGGRLAIVTGRGMASARYSLGGLMDRFDLASSAFLEDEPRGMAKPNPEALTRAIGSVGCTRGCVYVGDSMEDFMMARAAAEGGSVPVWFCAVVGAVGGAGAADKRRAMFERAGAECILDSIHDIPKTLNLT